MCRIFAGQDPARYESETRSIRLNGYTSIRLERAYWAMLEDMAARESLTTPQFISRLHDEVIELRGEARNFTSLLRCVCLVYSEQRGERAAVMAAE